MAEQAAKQSGDEARDAIPLKSFLELWPPGKTGAVRLQVAKTSPDKVQLDWPDMELYCENELCRGMRFFERVSESVWVGYRVWEKLFVDYRCKNCETTGKEFALAICYCGQQGKDKAFKFGELPRFGPYVPTKVIELIGPDRELFLMGRRAESQGMGIGAFTYYRRVVEDQKTRIIDQVIKVGEKIKAPDEAISLLQKARTETQFSAAVQSIKDGIPQVLLIDGHNPFMLLHRALREGLHAESDEKCLELATSIRVVLSELANRLGQALKDEAELKGAVHRLLHAKGKKRKNDETKKEAENEREHGGK